MKIFPLPSGSACALDQSKSLAFARKRFFFYKFGFGQQMEIGNSSLVCLVYFQTNRSHVGRGRSNLKNCSEIPRKDTKSYCHFLKLMIIYRMDCGCENMRICCAISLEVIMTTFKVLGTKDAIAVEFVSYILKIDVESLTQKEFCFKL
jgi:hypothetical protein